MNLKEKIESLHFCAKNAYGRGYQHAIDDVLNLPELKEAIERAEKWDEFCSDKANILEIPTLVTIVEKAKKFDSLTKDLRVKEKCENSIPIKKGEPFYSLGYRELLCNSLMFSFKGNPDCPLCEDTGETSRLLTDTEKMGVIKDCLTMMEHLYHDRAFTMPSGKKVVRI